MCFGHLPAAMPPRQVVELQHAEHQGHARHGQHEHDEDVLFRGPRNVTVDQVWTRPSLSTHAEWHLLAEGKNKLENHVLFFIFYLAHIKRVQEYSIQEVLEAEKHHLHGTTHQLQ